MPGLVSILYSSVDISATQSLNISYMLPTLLFVNTLLIIFAHFQNAVKQKSVHIVPLMRTKATSTVVHDELD